MARKQEDVVSDEQKAARDAFYEAGDSHSLARLLLLLPNKKPTVESMDDDWAGPWGLGVYDEDDPENGIKKGDRHDQLMVGYQMVEQY